MGEPEQHEIPFKERRLRFRNPKLRRGIFLLPAAFTSANLLCGYYAIVASLVGAPDDFNRAAKAIGLAILFDSLDGRVARMTGTNTEFGVQFDSLADVVSFGVAPAILAYAWGIRSVTAMNPEALHQLGLFGWVCCLFFLICCAWRLYGAGRIKVFCRNANAGCCRSDCGGGSCFASDRAASRLALVGGVAFDGCGAGRTDGQHDSLLQFQGSSVDAEATGHPDSLSDYARRGHLGVFGSSARASGWYVRGARCHATSCAFRAASYGFADRVIHASV